MFAEACADQTLDSWIEAHIHMVEFYDGVSRLWIPDNAKTGVVKPCYYEPQIHATYQELADHYDTAILPTRTYRPRDKAKAESAVLHAERRILARLRDQDFFSLGSINEGHPPMLERAQRPSLPEDGRVAPGTIPRTRSTRRYDRCRPTATSWGRWRAAKANIDYHVQVDWHNYSVPYQLTQQLFDVRLAARTVELFHKGRRVAAHPRSRVKGELYHRSDAPPQGARETSGVDARPSHPLGPRRWTAVQPGGDLYPGKQTPSRAGLSLLHGHPAAGKGGWPRTHGSGLSPRLGLGCGQLPEHRIDPQDQAGSTTLPEPEEDISSPVGHHDNIRGKAYYQTQETLNAPDPGS